MNAQNDPGHGNSPAAWTAVIDHARRLHDRHARVLVRPPVVVWVSAGLVVVGCDRRRRHGQGRLRRRGPAVRAEGALLECSTTSSPEPSRTLRSVGCARSLAEVEAAALARPAALDALAALARGRPRQDHRRGQAREPVARRPRRHPRPGRPRRPVRDRRRERDQRADRGAQVRRLARRPRGRARRRVACPCCARTSSPSRTRCSRRAPRAPTSCCSSSPRSTTPLLQSLHDLIRELGMTPLVETHSADEVTPRRRPGRPRHRRQRPRPRHLRARPRPVRSPRADLIPERRHPRRRVRGQDAADVAHYRARRRRRRARRRGARHDGDPIATLEASSWQVS